MFLDYLSANRMYSCNLQPYYIDYIINHYNNKKRVENKINNELILNFIENTIKHETNQEDIYLNLERENFEN